MCEFKASLAYKESVRTAELYSENPDSKIKNKRLSRPSLRVVFPRQAVTSDGLLPTHTVVDSTAL